MINKQSKKLFSELVNRIALALLVNQGLLLLLSSIASLLEMSFVSSFGEGVTLDIVFRLLECVVYFVSFVIPVNIFNKMNNNAENEVYEPKECIKSTPPQVICMLGIGLGATALAVYVNYFLINLFSDYSEFSQKYLWSAELDDPYQVIIYFTYCAIIPAIVEELLFRGTVCRSLKAYGKKSAVLISALAFALMHSNIEQLLYAFVAGLFLGWIYVETQNVLYPMLLHFLNNLLSVIGDVIYAKCSPEIYDAYSDASIIAVYTVAVISLVCYLILFRKKGSIFDKTVMKPDENGEEVMPLSAREKVSGFFTVRMTIFIAYSIFIMTYYIYLSTQLI